MSQQSEGTVRTVSADPSDPPVFDPAFLSHPLDRAMLIDGVRQMMLLYTAPVLANKTRRRVLWPADDSDTAIWEHVKANLGSSWHMCGTARMGRSKEEACVDHNFKVFGLQRLRVVDLSVCPFVPK
jgi:choline dehydrogenase-like flavoprotein